MSKISKDYLPPKQQRGSYNDRAIYTSYNYNEKSYNCNQRNTKVERSMKNVNDLGRSVEDHQIFLRNMRKNYSQSNSLVGKSNDHGSLNHSNSKERDSATSSKRKASETFESTLIMGMLKSKILKKKSKETSKISNEYTYTTNQNMNLENTITNNNTQNLSSMLSNDRHSIEDLKNSYAKLGGTTAQNLDKKNYIFEISNDAACNFNKTTKFSRQLGDRGSSTNSKKNIGLSTQVSTNKNSKDIYNSQTYSKDNINQIKEN